MLMVPEGGQLLGFSRAGPGERGAALPPLQEGPSSRLRPVATARRARRPPAPVGLAGVGGATAEGTLHEKLLLDLENWKGIQVKSLCCWYC